jgi:RHS repeat-associated protein
MVTNVFAADIDADGVAEIVCNQDAGNRDIMVRRWSGTQLLPPVLYASHFCDNDVLGGGDFDGDGRTDLICGIDKVGITGTTGVVPDLMLSAGNGLGGTTSVQYTPSSAFPTANNPGVQPLVTAVTAGDGRGGSPTSTYSYSGAKVDQLEGFLGFASIAKTLPCLPGESACPTVTTYYSQALPSRGQPTLVQKGDGSNFVLQQTQCFYQTQPGPNPPRVALLQEARTTDCGPTGGSNTTSVTYTYDSYGNQTQILSHGLVNPDGTETGNDELATNLTYRAPDTTNYLVDRVALREQVDVSGGGGGTVLTSVQYGYNDPGDLTTVTTLVRAPGQPDHPVTQTMGYDGAGNLTSIIGELGGQTLFGYDSDNLHVQTVTNPGMEMTTTVWDPRCGQPTSVTDPNSQTTHTSYDTLCRPTHTDLPNGGFVQTSYALTGDPQTQHVHVETPGSSGNEFSESYFDGFGRTYETRQRGPASADIVVDTAYNPRGSVSSMSEPHFDGDDAGETTFSYDHFDRLLVTTLPDNRTTTKSYGLWSETTTDAGGKSVTTTRSTRSSTQTKTIGGQQVTTTSTFDPLGRLTGLQEAAGQDINNQWNWSYDSLGRKTGQNDPDAGAWTWSYDDSSRTTTQTDAIGQATVSAFDNMGRPLRKTSLSGVTTLGYSESRGSYSNIGRLTSVTSPGTSLQLDYDSLGNAARQTRTIDGTTFVMGTDYDLVGRVAAVTYYDQANGSCSVPGTCTIGPFTYDDAGRVAGVQGIVDDVTYDAAGRPLVQSNANGTVTTKTYWPHRGLLNTLVTTTPAQTGPVQDLDYLDYDDVGNLKQVTGTIPSESWQYGYDDGYRMTSASSGAGDVRDYTYDPIGRIKSSSAVGTYDYPLPGQPRPHAPVSVSSLGSFTYDANGNLLVGNGRALGWNAENLPTQVTSGGATTSFAYDGTGERVKKLSPTGTSYYPFGDDYEVTDGVVTAYVSVPGLGVVAKRVGTGTSIQTFWLHTDRLGSINAVTTDGAQYPAGSLVLRRTYAPYGETLSTAGTHAESRGWIDQRNDGETGLTYLHARYFDPQLGIFLSPDPIGVAGGMNLYGYALGDPVNGTDRTGLTREGGSGHRAEECARFPWACSAGQMGGGWGGMGGPGPGSMSSSELMDAYGGLPPVLVGENGYIYPRMGENGYIYPSANPDSGQGVTGTGSQNTETWDWSCTNGADGLTCGGTLSVHTQKNPQTAEILLLGTEPPLIDPAMIGGRQLPYFRLPPSRTLPPNAPPGPRVTPPRPYVPVPQPLPPPPPLTPPWYWRLMEELFRFFGGDPGAPGAPGTLPPTVPPDCDWCA